MLNGEQRAKRNSNDYTPNMIIHSFQLGPEFKINLYTKTCLGQ